MVLLGELLRSVGHHMLNRAVLIRGSSTLLCLLLDDFQIHTKTLLNQSYGWHDFSHMNNLFGAATLRVALGYSYTIIAKLAGRRDRSLLPDVDARGSE